VVKTAKGAYCHPVHFVCLHLLAVCREYEQQNLCKLALIKSYKQQADYSLSHLSLYITKKPETHRLLPPSPFPCHTEPSALFPILSLTDRLVPAEGREEKEETSTEDTSLFTT